MGYTVKSVSISGRWVSKELKERVDTLIGIGKPFDPANVSAAMEMVTAEINKNEAAYSIRLLGSTSVLYNTAFSCPVNDSSKEVTVEIKPFYLRIDLYNVGNNILPIPRTAKPTFFKQVPASLLATAPMIHFFNDGKLGTAVGLQTNTDLLHLGKIKKTGDSSTNNRLDLGLYGQKSINKPFYDFAGSIQFTHPVYADSGIGWNIGVRFAKTRHPFLANIIESGHLNIFASVNGSGKIKLINKYLVAAGARFSTNDYSLTVGKFQQNESVYNLNAVIDGRLGNGFARSGIWFNATIPNNSSLKPYQQLACRFGYGVSLGKGHNTPVLETLISGGYTWKTPLPYNGFFAGNNASNFLYTDLQSFNNAPLPDGPLIRSLGHKTGGVAAVANTATGGTSFWGLNLSFSVPIKKWSKPLIPDIQINDVPLITMRSAIKKSANSAVNFIADDLAENQGYTDDAADAAANRIADRDIRPALNYLADKANVFSIKPLALFDIGQIYNRNGNNKIWSAAGIGLQVNIVNARLEIGYMHTVSPKADADKGNFLMRFLVQNFF